MNIGEIKAKLSLDSHLFNSELTKAKRSLKETGNQAKDTARDFGQLESAFASIGAGMALAGMTNIMKSVIAESQKLTNALIGLQSIAKAFGISAGDATDAAKKLAEDGLAPVSTYATALKNILSTGIGLDKAIELINVYKDRASFGRAESISFSQAVANLSETFKTESSELGDLSGMTENYSKILEKGLKIMQEKGKTVAKNVEQLSELERAEAKYLGTLSVSQPYLGDAQKLTEGLSGKQAQLNAKWIEAKQNLGEALIPELERLMDIVTPLIEEFVRWSDANKETVSGIATATTTAVGLTAAVGGLVTIVNLLSVAFKGLQASLGIWGAISVVVGIAATSLLAYKEGTDAVTEATRKMESQQRNSFIEMANKAEALEKKIATLKQGTEEHSKASAYLKQVYDQLIASNPELKSGFEQQGKSVQWLKGEVRNLSAEYVALQKNAFNAAFALMNSEVSQKRLAMSNAQSEIALFEGKDLDVNLKKQLDNKKEELRLLKGDIVGIQQQQFKLYKDYEHILNPKVVTGDQVIKEMSSSPNSSPASSGSPSTSTKSSGKSTAEKAAEVAKRLAEEAYRNAMAIENARVSLRKAKGEEEEQVLRDHIANLNKIYKSHLGYLNGHEQEKLQLFTQTANAEKELQNAIEQKNHETFQHSVDWIADKKMRHELSLEEELAAWERVMKRYKAGTEERKQAEREYYRVKFDLIEKAERAEKELIEKSTKTIVDTLKEQSQDYLDYLRDKHEDELDRLEDKLADIEKSYDRQIEQQEEKLRLLDREYEKEDRLKRLRDIDSEISGVKADKRFEFIDEAGNKILTYDRARVAELEKQRDELKDQYEREDVKQAIRDELDRLKDAKDRKIEIMREEIDAVKERHKQEIDAEKDRWDNLVKAAEEGTLSFDELMNGEDGWYSKAIGELKEYVDGVEAQMKKLREAYASMPSPSSSSRSSGGGGGGGSSSGSIGTTTPSSSKNSGSGTWHADGSFTPKKHSGGLADGYNFRSPFTLAPDEITAVLQRSEFVFQPGQIRSLMEFASSQSGQGGDTIHIGNVTVNADNADEFFRSIDEYRRAIRR